MNITTKTFAEFAEDQKKHFGIVILGAGEPHQEWVDGISKMLLDEKIYPVEPVFDTAYILSDNALETEGRTDLVLYFSKEADANVGKLAMWRLRFGNCSWMDDFIVNHAADYKSKSFVDSDKNEKPACQLTGTDGNVFFT